MADRDVDQLSLLSTASESVEERESVKDDIHETIEVLKPTYNESQLKCLIDFIKSMTFVFALNPMDWNETVESVIKLWLLDIDELMLTIFYDSNTLTACIGFPLAPVYDIAYFLRKPNHIFTINGFHDEIIYGTIDEDVSGCLLRVLEKIYAPIFFNYGNWTNNVKLDLCNSLHKFLTLLTGIHYKLSGMTVLYVPNESLNFPGKGIDANSEMLKRLETVAVFWGSQIRSCLTDREELIPYDLLCPCDEVNFWLYRYEILQGLNGQLKCDDIMNLMNLLKKAQSVYVKQIFELAIECEKEMKKAKSNIEYLQVLVKPCTELNLTESPIDIPPQLPKIIHIIRFIYLKSHYFNTSKDVTGLMRALSNQIILYCREKIDIHSVLRGKPRFGIKMCNRAIYCCLCYKQIFKLLSQSNLGNEYGNVWVLDTSLIFNHIAAFIKRLHDLIDICEAMTVFGRVDELGEVRKPIFGGNRGEEFEIISSEIEKLFLGGLKDIEENSADVILDVHNTQWYEDIIKYKRLIQDIQEIVENLMSNVFFNVANVEEAIETLSSLHFFSHRAGIRPAYVQQASLVYTLYLNEITLTTKNNITYTNERPAWLPINGFKANSLNVNINRITRLHKILINCDWIPEISLGATVKERYNMMLENYNKNFSRVFDEWTKSINNETLHKLNRTLISRSKARRNALECNIDFSILNLCKEAMLFNYLGFPMPSIINQLFAKRKILGIIYENVMSAVLNYNKLLNALSLEEQKLFEGVILKCDKKITPIVEKLAWSDENSNAYINECITYMINVQQFVEMYKHTNIRIRDICEKICKTPMLNLRICTAVDLQYLFQQIDGFKKNATKKILAHYNLIIDIIMVVYKGFQYFIKDISPDWDIYIQRLDRMIEEALKQNAKASLDYIYSALHGDGIMGPSPILIMSVTLKGKEIIYEPNVQEIFHLFGNLLNSLVESVKIFPRLYEQSNFQTAGNELSFHEMIAKHDGCKLTQKQIIAEVQRNQNELKKFKENWYIFKSIWEVDKTTFMKKYKDADCSAATFVSNIGRYIEISNQVSIQETISTVHFIVVNSNNLKNAIQTHIKDWQYKHIEVLKQKAYEKLSDIYMYIDQNSELMQIVPRTVIAMQESLALYERLRSEVKQKETEFPRIFELFKALRNYAVVVPQHLENRRLELENEWEKFLNILQEAEEMLGNSKSQFKSVLQTKADSFKDVARTFSEEIQNSMLMSSQNTAEEAFNTIVNYREKLKDLCEQERNVISGLAVFHINQAENEDLKRLDTDLNMIDEVWDLISNWQHLWELYKEENLNNIKNFENLENEAAGIFKRLSRIYKQLQDTKWDILDSTKAQIINFRKTLPIIFALRNEAMRPRHWQSIKLLVGSDFAENYEHLNLETCVSLNIQAYVNEIQDIAKTAIQEFYIENEIKNMSEKFSKLSIEIEPFRNDIMRITSADEVFNNLEDNIVKLASYKSTKFGKHFAKEIDYWEKTLSYIMETLEKALIVQRRWLDLDHIFSGEDIQNQMLKEKEQFSKITSTWIKLTSSLHEAGSIMRGILVEPTEIILQRLKCLEFDLETIQKGLETYFQTQRQIFPRFYFLSNAELLEILANSNEPENVQPHLKNLFGNLYKLNLKKIIGKKLQWEAHGMHSKEGEYIEFLFPVYIEGTSSTWLQLVEDAMRQTLKEKLRQARTSFKRLSAEREKWISLCPGQFCLICSKIEWTSSCIKSLIQCKAINERKPLKKLKRTQNQMLERLSQIIQRHLSNEMRLKISNLITLEIHGRDVIDRMYKMNCKTVNNFEWFSQLKFYWERDQDNCVIKQTNTEFCYAYEFIENSARLVVTPLTERCYVALTTALYRHRGGCLTGPNGTGKTETVKALSKMLGIWMLVINCSEGFDYKSIGICFAGLAQTGAWGCFVEINRIKSEVLSVLSQQINNILQESSSGSRTFSFEGVEMKLSPNVGLFLTMSSGRSGHIEIPDNLKSMFRPISMITPDYILIVENLLFSEGFHDTRNLARKVITFYELLKLELTKQNNYNFGLRSMTAFIKYAAQTKRSFPKESEEKIICLALKATNMSNRTPFHFSVFNEFISDIFPNVTALKIDNETLKNCIKEELVAQMLQPIDPAISKVLQLNEAKCSRHTILIVGGPLSGKSTTWKVLQGVHSRMAKLNEPNWYPVVVYPINPKSITLGELYGEYNSSRDWEEGFLSVTMRKLCADETPDFKWLLFDGPIDAVWMEMMNSLMDDNRILTLANNERIRTPSQVTLLFEVDNLSNATPASVSRCGIIYSDYNEWGWKPYIDSWLQRKISKNYIGFLSDLVKSYFEKSLLFRKQISSLVVCTNELNLVIAFCRLFDCFESKYFGIDESNKERLQIITKLWFFFALVWSIGGNIDETNRSRMDGFLRNMDDIFPVKGTIYDYFVDPKQNSFVHWEELLADNWKYDNKESFSKIIVPTVDTIRYEYIVLNLISNNVPTMLIGPPGSGKSTLANSFLGHLDKEKYILMSFNFSAQTTTNVFQESIESRLAKQTKKTFIPIANKWMLIFIDDINMPEPDTYGSQPVLESIRQWINYKFWYSRKNKEQIFVHEISLLSAMRPTISGEQQISLRTLNCFNTLYLTPTPSMTNKRIFGTILAQKLRPFAEELAESITAASIDLYNTVKTKMLPTPTKIHYMFNLRDISKLYQGLFRCNPKYHRDRNCILRLWVHECFRVFCDRLNSQKDIQWFKNEVDEMLWLHFNLKLQNVCPESPIFGDFMNNNGYYEDITNFKELQYFMYSKLEDYNNSSSGVKIDFVIFKESIDHLTRIIRVISQPQGHMLFLASEGMGRQRLSLIASHICKLSIFKINVTSNYKLIHFRGDLRKLYKMAGIDMKKISFIITNNQIVEDSFIDAINTLITTGENNIFNPEIIHKIARELDPKGFIPGKDVLYASFKHNVMENLRVIICLSPTANSFRYFIQNCPAVLKLTTINCLIDWPESALSEIGRIVLKNCEFFHNTNEKCDNVQRTSYAVSPINNNELRESLAINFPTTHATAVNMAESMKTEKNRHTHLALAHYVEFVENFTKLYETKKRKIISSVNMLKQGISKVKMIENEVSAMSKDLTISQKQVADSQLQCNEFLRIIDIQKLAVDEQKKIVAQNRNIIRKEEAFCSTIAEQMQAELGQVLPALDEAIKGLDLLNKKDLSEVKSYGRPPMTVEKIMEAVMILMGKPPNWVEAKKQLGETNFLNDLKAFDKNTISDKTLKRIATYTQNSDLEPEKVGLVSSACKSLSLYIRAIENYGKVYRIVAPKRMKHETALSSLKLKHEILDNANKKLDELSDRMQGLEVDFIEKSEMQKQLIEKSQILRMKISRAVALLESLKKAQNCWFDLNRSLIDQDFNLAGDCYLSSAFLSYQGAFDATYRMKLSKAWKNNLNLFKISFSAEFQETNFLVESTTINNWNLYGLSNDIFSLQNGILIMKSFKWPLIIDPYDQGLSWIKKLEGDSLDVIDFCQENYLDVIEMGLECGKSVLIQNVQEKIDHDIYPLLEKSIILHKNKKMIMLREKLVHFDDNFRLYIITNLKNPIYTPDIMTKVNLVNFSMTEDGLRSQLLDLTMRKEKPMLEEQKRILTASMLENKKKMFDLGNELLNMFCEAKKNFLEDNELLETLQVTEKASLAAKESLAAAEELKTEIGIVKQSYLPIATRATLLFLTLMDMSKIDPMYHFSLSSYLVLFKQSIEKSSKHGVLKERINNLNNFHTYAVYKNTCRSLFACHKLLFAFHMCCNILKFTNKLLIMEYKFLLNGGKGVDRKEQPTNPFPEYLHDNIWDNITLLDKIPGFHGLVDTLHQYPQEWKEWLLADTPESEPLIGDWKGLCNDFQRMLMIRAFRPDRLLHSVNNFVFNTLGQAYTDPPAAKLEDALAESTAHIPLIFILSPGTDPSHALLRLVEQHDMYKKFFSYNMGHGANTVAQLISEGSLEGHWVFLANCHLSLDWMTVVDKIINDLKTAKIHRKFRLWLSSLSHPKFPVSILNKSIKIIAEPPKGIKANLKHIYNTITDNQFSRCEAHDKYQKLLFSLSFFHSLLVERKKFHSLGWNTPYYFNDSDFHISESSLVLCLEQYRDTPWVALKYLIANIHYGGHVTDDWDNRLLAAYSCQYFQEAVLAEDNFKLSSLTSYYIPPNGNLQSLNDYINLLPNSDRAEVFGLHPNSLIPDLMRESREFCDILLNIKGTNAFDMTMPYTEEGLEIVNEIQSHIPDKVDYRIIAKILEQEKTPLLIVLLKEIETYNQLLTSIHHDLDNVSLVITGKGYINKRLEEIVTSLCKGKIPFSWLIIYESIKPAASFVRDLLMRVEYFADWAKNARPPTLYWLGAFIHPTSLLSAIALEYARENKMSIDELSWEYEFSTENLIAHELPSVGIFVKGLFLEGAGWNQRESCLQQPEPMQFIINMPIVNFQPVKKNESKIQKYYRCPCYYCPKRAASFVTVIDLKLGQETENFWIKQGTALLLSVAD